MTESTEINFRDTPTEKEIAPQNVTCKLAVAIDRTKSINRPARYKFALSLQKYVFKKAIKYSGNTAVQSWPQRASAVTQLTCVLHKSVMNQ